MKLDYLKNFIMRFYLILIFLFLYVPIAILIVLSFNNSRSRVVWGGFTLKWYKQLFTEKTVLLALRNTLLIAVLSALIATIIAVFAAVGIIFMNRKKAAVVLGFGNIPVLNADIVTGIILMLVFSKFFNLGMGSVLLAHITFNIPYVLLSVLPALKGMNFSIYEAARDLGASAGGAFFKVVLPEIMSSVIGGFFMALTLSMDDFVITYFTKGPGMDTLSTLIYGQLKRGLKPEMYALSSLIFVVVLVILMIVNFSNSKKKSENDY